MPLTCSGQFPEPFPYVCTSLWYFYRRVFVAMTETFIALATGFPVTVFCVVSYENPYLLGELVTKL